MAKYLFERPNFTDIASAKDYLWRLVEALEHLPDEESTTTNNITNTTINTVDLTDEIVEVGTNDGWSYRKWKNGTAECWISKEYTVDSTNLYSADYPSSLFVGAPKVQMTLDTGDSAGEHSLWMLSFGKGTSSKTPKVKVRSPYYYPNDEQYIVGQSFTIHYYAIGRWA